MTDEVLINRLYDIVDNIARIGGEQERTSIVPGILVVDATPVDLPTGYIKIVNPRDGTWVPCLTIAGLVVQDNDLVNVLFTKGTEPVALSQSFNSPSSTLKVSEVWDAGFDTVVLQITDAEDVGIGTVGPDAKLDILDTGGAQLRLTHTDGSKFADFTLDTSHDLTIDPSSTGDIILNATVLVPDELQHIGDTTTKIGFTSSVITDTAGGVIMFRRTNAAQDLVEIGDVAGTGDVDVLLNADQAFLRGSDGYFGVGTTTPRGILDISDSSAAIYFGDGTGPAQINFDGSVTSRDMSWMTAGSLRWVFRCNGDAESGSDAGSNFQIISRTDAGAVKETVLRIIRQTGYTMIGAGTPASKLHVDQSGPTDNVPVVSLHQADTSEEFIDFLASVGAGNPIDTAAIGTYYGKVRVAVNGTFKYMALYNS